MDVMERIHKAFCGMPYGASAHFVRTTTKEMTLEHIACNLENLAEVLGYAAETSGATAKELAEIKAEMRAVKSLLARFS